LEEEAVGVNVCRREGSEANQSKTYKRETEVEQRHENMVEKGGVR